MIQLAVAILRLPNGSIVLQRRDKEARVSPGKIGFFGGHVESGESSRQAIQRELKEETGLDISAHTFDYVTEFQLESDAGEGKLNFNLYQVSIADANFTVHEGQGAETYTVETALLQPDLTTSARYALETAIGKD